MASGHLDFCQGAVRAALSGRGFDLLRSDGQLEYDFLVAPGASASAISLRFEGVEGLRIDAQGDLLLSVAGGEIRQHKPLVYQTVDGVRQELAGGYVLKDLQTVGFEVSQHDPSQPLVIDPILSYSTYLGGKNGDIGWDIAVDPDGSAYVAGETLSVLTGLITPGAFQTHYAGGLVDHTNLIGGDAFVAKLNPVGSALVYMTYLGGSGDDAADAIAVDGQGNACLTGFTDSPNFRSEMPSSRASTAPRRPFLGSIHWTLSWPNWTRLVLIFVFHLSRR